MSSRSQIKKGAIISYIAIILNIIAGLLYTPWMVREIGQANYGLYALATSFISLFVLDFGISASLTRFLAKYRAEKDMSSMSRILGATYRIYYLIAAIILIVVIVLYFNLDTIFAELTASEIATFKKLFAIVGLFAVISFPAMTQNAMLSSHEKFVQLKVCDLLRKFLTIGLVVVALSLNWGVEALVFANVAAGLTVIVIKFFIIRKDITFRAEFSSNCRSFYKKILSFSVWITIMAFANKFMYNMAPTILGIVSGAIAISLFTPASTIGGYFYLLAEALNGLFLPLISRKIANHQEGDINQLLIKVGKFQMFTLGLVVTGFTCVGHEFIQFWLGKAFAPSYLCTILILLPALYEYSQQIGTQMIVAKDFVKIQAIGFGVISIITLGMSCVLAVYWGAVGVCIAISVGGFAKVLFQSYIFKNKLHLDTQFFYRECLVKSTIPIIVTIAAYWVLPHFELQHLILNILLNGIIVSILFVIVSKLMIFRKINLRYMVSMIKS